MKNKRFTILIPCFNEDQSIPTTYKKIKKILYKKIQINWNLLFINDGSTDKTEDVLFKLVKNDKKVTAITLSRNFGHQAAIQAGLDHLNSDFVGIIDCDLQDPIEKMLELLSWVQNKNYDVAYGIRQNRKESIFLKVCYYLFYKIINLISDSEYPKYSGDFCVLNKKALNILKKFPEKIKILRGLRAYIGLSQIGIPYDRPARQAGVSKYNFVKLCSLALSSFISFSSLPLRVSSFLGFIFGALAVLLALLFIINRIIPEIFPFGYFIGGNPGITTISLLYLFFTSMILFFLGIIGEYINCILVELKARPPYIIKSKIGRKV